MTRQELLDRLLRMKAENENMDLPVIVRLDAGQGAEPRPRPVYGEVTHCCGGMYTPVGGENAGLLIARRLAAKQVKDRSAP